MWFEDEPGEKEAAARLASQPHLVISVDPAVRLASSTSTRQPSRDGA